METTEKTGCCSPQKSCSSDPCHTSKDGDDPETLAMFATAAIMITGFLIVAFVSGPAGLIITLIMLSCLGLYYALTSKKSCK